MGNLMSTLVLFRKENFNGVECDLWKDENDDIFMSSEQLGMVLGYSNPRKGINTLVTRNPYLRKIDFSSGITMKSEAGDRETRVFNEDGIYEVALLAGTEKAKEFRSWVRKILKLLRKGELELLRKKIEEDRPNEQVMSSKTNKTMMIVAKELKLSGRNKLFMFLRSEGILMSGKGKQNLPYQQYIDSGYFSVVIKIKIIEGEVVDIPVTLVSAKGVDYILKRLEKRAKKKAC